MGDDIRVDGPREPYGTIGPSRSAARNARSVRRASLRAPVSPFVDVRRRPLVGIRSLEAT